MKFLIFTFAALFSCSHAFSQQKIFTKADTLRGSNGPFREKWNVMHYDITVEPDIAGKRIRGINKMRFYDDGAKMMQIDLQEPMMLDSAVFDGRPLDFSREGNVYWLMFRDTARMYKIAPGSREITFYFHGKPREAKRAPWDGGWIWKKDSAGNPWVTVACQGLGASVWYPCKDIQSDEPDSGAILRIIAPDSLVAIGNGHLKQKLKTGSGKTTTVWETKNPINNYCIIPYIGNYTSIEENYPSIAGNLPLTYWVLKGNEDKAKKQFREVPKMLKAFEYWFGKYPFREDGYQLIEAPHLGMEHQSAVAYGNKFQNGYSGQDLSGTGIGLLWDFIIVHESGHEWFANSITTNDIADMWVHEGFTNYSETLFTEYYWGKDSASKYVQGIRRNIENDKPIIGLYGVNEEGSGDMYYKAGNMLHLIRQLCGDKKFRDMLLSMNKTFYHRTTTSREIEMFMTKKTGMDLQPIFDQYLRTVKVPKLEYRINGNLFSYRFTDVVNNFSLKVPISFGAAGKKIAAVTSAWKTMKLSKNWDGNTVVADPDYYIGTERILSSETTSK